MNKKTIVSSLIFIVIIILALISFVACNTEGEQQDSVIRTITFVSNGGSEVEAIIGYEGIEISAPADPQKDDYIFDGWYTDDGIFETPFDFILMPYSDTTLYAKWIEDTNPRLHTITFDSLGGSAVSSIEELSETEISIPQNLEKEGFVFAGWYTDNNSFENEFQSSVMPSEDLTLYAKWLELFSLRLLNENEENGEVIGSGEYLSDEEIILSAISTGEEYVFAGWYNGSILLSRNTEYTYTMPEKDTFVFAKWSMQYTVEITNDETKGTTTGDGIYLTDDEVTLTATPAEDFEFGGWYDNNTLISKDLEYTFTIRENGLSCTARWNQKFVLEVVSENDIYGTVSGSGIYTAGSAVTITAQAGDSYTFSGWWGEEENLLSNDAEYIFTMPDNAVFITGVWEYIEGQLDIDATEQGDGYEISGVGIIEQGHTDIVIPSVYNGKPVVKIADNAFSGSQLTSVIVPDSVTEIGENSFRNCGSLTEITLPDGILSIGNNAFSGCNLLSSINIPDSVTNLGTNALEGCGSLTSLSLPSDCLGTIGGIQVLGQLFGPEEYPNSILVTQPVVQIAQVVSCKFIMNTAASNTQNYYYPKDLKSISVTGTSIAANTFNGCYMLTDVNIADTVTSIGESAFESCSALTEINIPSSVTSIGNRAFYNCGSLKTVTLDSSNIPQITGSNQIFDQASSELVVFVPVNAESNYKNANGWSAYASKIWAIGSVAVILVNLDTDCGEITRSLRAQPGTSVTITAVPNENYKYVNWTDKNGGVFNSGNPSYTFTMPDTPVIYTVKWAPRYTFALQFTLINGDQEYAVTGIGDISANTDVEVPSIYNSKYVVEISADAFKDNSNIKSIYVPDTIKIIGSGAFANCANLVTLNLPSSVEQVGAGAFDSSPNIRYHEIENKYRFLGKWLIKILDTDVQSIKLPGDIAGIYFNAFDGCEDLDYVTIYSSTPPTFSDGLFDYTHFVPMVYVPMASVELYKATAGWTDYQAQIFDRLCF